MRIVVAIDKFKGSATSRQLCDAIEQAINQNSPGIEVIKVPIADGGDGTMQTIKELLGYQCQEFHVQVPGCLECLPPVHAHYLFDDENVTAYMDLATASGLALVPIGERDVMHASTIGAGVMIAHAIENGARNIVLGLGGSATCDGAMGILAAQGCEFLDVQGNVIRPCGGNLSLIDHIDTQGLSQRVRDVSFTLLTDVDNPLLGEQGAAAVFAPQKGASPQQVAELENGLSNLARFMPENVVIMPGAGAAGGVAAGMVAMLDAVITPGVNFVLELSNFDKIVADAQIVITGLIEFICEHVAALNLAKDELRKTLNALLAFGGAISAIREANYPGNYEEEYDFDKKNLMALRLNVELLGEDMSAVMLVREDMTFEELSNYISFMFDREEGHLYRFDCDDGCLAIHPEDEADEDGVIFADRCYIGHHLSLDDGANYTYDYGEEWNFHIKVEKIMKARGNRYPKTIEMTGEPPIDGDDGE